eukprot:c37856_g1_i1 orf=1-192(-)
MSPCSLAPLILVQTMASILTSFLLKGRSRERYQYKHSRKRSLGKVDVLRDIGLGTKSKKFTTFN